jgi:hypothetical protein
MNWWSLEVVQQDYSQLRLSEAYRRTEVPTPSKHTTTVSKSTCSRRNKNYTFVPHANEIIVAAILDTMRARQRESSDIMMVPTQKMVIVLKISYFEGGC